MQQIDFWLHSSRFCTYPYENAMDDYCFFAVILNVAMLSYDFNHCVSYAPRSKRNVLFHTDLSLSPSCLLFLVLVGLLFCRRYISVV